MTQNNKKYLTHISDLKQKSFFITLSRLSFFFCLLSAGNTAKQNLRLGKKQGFRNLGSHLADKSRLAESLILMKSAVVLAL